MVPEPPRGIQLPNGRRVGHPRGRHHRATGSSTYPPTSSVAGWWSGGSRLGDPFGQHPGRGPRRLADPGARAVRQPARRARRVTGSTSGPRAAADLRGHLAAAATAGHDRAGVVRSTRPTGPRRLTLVTCAGPYDAARGGYQNLAVIIATPLGKARSAAVTRGLKALARWRVGRGAGRARLPGAQRGRRRASPPPRRRRSGPPATCRPPPADAPAEGMYVAQRRSPRTATVEVQTWLRTATPITELRLTTTDPDLLPGSVESLDLRVHDARRHAARAARQRRHQPAADPAARRRDRALLQLHHRRRAGRRLADRRGPHPGPGAGAWTSTTTAPAASYAGWSPRPAPSSTSPACARPRTSTQSPRPCGKRHRRRRLARRPHRRGPRRPAPGPAGASGLTEAGQSRGRRGRRTISVKRRCRSRASHSPRVSSMQLDSSTDQICSRVRASPGSITSTLIS